MAVLFADGFCGISEMFCVSLGGRACEECGNCAGHFNIDSVAFQATFYEHCSRCLLLSALK